MEYLRVGVGEPLLKLSFGLDTGILHVLEVLAHVLHLVLKVTQIRVVSLLTLNHLCSFSNRSLLRKF